MNDNTPPAAPPSLSPPPFARILGTVDALTGVVTLWTPLPPAPPRRPVLRLVGPGEG